MLKWLMQNEVILGVITYILKIILPLACQFVIWILVQISDMDFKAVLYIIDVTATYSLTKCQKSYLIEQ